MNITGVIREVQREMSKQLREDRSVAADELSAARRAKIAAKLAKAEFEKKAAEADYYIENVDGTIGAVPILGKPISTVITAGSEEHAMFNTPLEDRPAMRDQLEVERAKPEGERNVFIDNPISKTAALGDRSYRDDMKSDANQADIAATRAEDRVSDAESNRDDAKTAFKDLIDGTKQMFEDIKRVSDAL